MVPSFSMFSIFSSLAMLSRIVWKFASMPPMKPPFGDIGHVAAHRLFHDAILDLLFRAHEKDFAAFLHFAFDPQNKFIEAFERFVQINDVDAVTGAENEPLHFRVPTLGLVTEVRARFKQVL